MPISPLVVRWSLVAVLSCVGFAANAQSRLTPKQIELVHDDQTLWGAWVAATASLIPGSDVKQSDLDLLKATIQNVEKTLPQVVTNNIYAIAAGGDGNIKPAPDSYYCRDAAIVAKRASALAQTHLSNPEPVLPPKPF